MARTSVMIKAREVSTGRCGGCSRLVKRSVNMLMSHKERKKTEYFRINAIEFCSEYSGSLQFTKQYYWLVCLKSEVGLPASSR